MTDEPTRAAPFSFRSAKPKETYPPASLGTDPQEAHPSPPPQRRKRGPNKPKTTEAPVTIKVDLAEAIAAAALLAKSDANAFASIVKTLNTQPAAARRRIAKALGRIFA